MVLQGRIDHTLRGDRPHDVVSDLPSGCAILEFGLFDMIPASNSRSTLVSLVPLEAIVNLRELYRQEMNCQIVHDSLHATLFHGFLLDPRKWSGRRVRLCHEWRHGDEGPDQGILCLAGLSTRGASALSAIRRSQRSENDRGTDQRRALDLMLFDCAGDINERDHPVS